MPVYEYACKTCGKHFEITCHIDEREQLARCPKCGSREVEPVLTASFSSPPPEKY